MAFTLLGTGTATAKNVNPESVNSGITASAACYNHNNPYKTYGRWNYDHKERIDWRADPLNAFHIQYKFKYYYTRRVEWHCTSCGKVISTTFETKTEVGGWENA